MARFGCWARAMAAGRSGTGVTAGGAVLYTWRLADRLRVKDGAMRIPASILVSALTGVSVMIGAAPSAEWSRFRGPNGTGVSDATNLPSDFGPSKNVVWKTAVPAGHSSPVLSETRVFLTGYDADRLIVLALDRASRRELGRRDLPRARKAPLGAPNGPASPSPVTDGAHVYAFFQDFGLAAFSADGREEW